MNHSHQINYDWQLMRILLHPTLSWFHPCSLYLAKIITNLTDCSSDDFHKHKVFDGPTLSILQTKSRPSFILDDNLFTTLTHHWYLMMSMCQSSQDLEAYYDIENLILFSADSFKSILLYIIQSHFILIFKLKNICYLGHIFGWHERSTKVNFSD